MSGVLVEVLAIRAFADIAHHCFSRRTPGKLTFFLREWFNLREWGCSVQCLVSKFQNEFV